MRYVICLTICISTILACQNNSKENKSAESSDSSKKTNAGVTTVSHADSLMGSEVFSSTCSNCHKDTSILRAPSKGVLSTMTPRAILAALDNGRMKAEAAKFSEDQRRAVAQWLTGHALNAIDNAPGSIYCFLYS